MIEDLEQLAESCPGAGRSSLFGKPSLALNKAHFACGFEDCLVVKIGREAIEHWNPKLEESHLFDPSQKGRPMKDWLQVPRQHEAFWPELISLAYNELS
jgi:hypothetical protein